MLKKSDVPAPPRPKEQVVNVPELGGDVVVRGLMLSDRLGLSITEGYGRMAAMLAACVFVDGGKPTGPVPLFTAEEWERWGGKHYQATISLWDKAKVLSDVDGAEAEKNSPAQKSESPVVSP